LARAAHGAVTVRDTLPAVTNVAERWNVRSTELSTKREIAAMFFRHSSPRIITVAATVAMLARLLLGRWSYADLVMISLTVLLTGVVEWVVHLFVLHAPVDSFVTTRMGGGISHRKHHLDPPDMRYLLLDGADAALFVAMLAAFSAAWSLPVAWLLGADLGPPYLTTLCGAYIGLLNYEWTHLMAHTRYRPRTRFYARLSRNHRLHHYRNERYWLGVTSNLGDRLLRSYPKSKGDVPLSETARNLDG
jgi:hypothetical protein